jgi:hypothetical protein
VAFWVVMMHGLVGGNMLLPFSGLKDYVWTDTEVIKMRIWLGYVDGLQRSHGRGWYHRAWYKTTWCRNLQDSNLNLLPVLCTVWTLYKYILLTFKRPMLAHANTHKKRP